MNHPPEIDVETARRRLDESESIFVDIRDPGAYVAAHIPGALHVNDHNIESFLKDTERSSTLVVYCDHGISSVGAAGFFLDRGFAEVVSMSGGFSAWKRDQPTESGGLD